MIVLTKKRFHNIVMQIVCDVNQRFWNVCASQPRKVHNEWQFKMFYARLKNCEILYMNSWSLSKVWDALLVSLWCCILNSTILEKKNHKPNDVDKIKYVYNMNSRRVVIESAFGPWTSKWHIFRLFNSRVNRALRITIGCCVLHNFCIKLGCTYAKASKCINFFK